MNIGDLFDSPWKILIVAVVIIVLFGSRKLPDAARSLGRSMRILKAEVQDLHHDHDEEPEQAKPALAAPQPEHQQRLEQLEQQLRDLKTQAPAGEAATVNGGAPLTDTQQTQQPG